MKILCLYLEQFKSKRASKLIILKKSLQKFNVFRIIVDTAGELLPHAIHLLKLRPYGAVQI